MLTAIYSAGFTVVRRLFSSESIGEPNQSLESWSGVEIGLTSSFRAAATTFHSGLFSTISYLRPDYIKTPPEPLARAVFATIIYNQ
jgi:hypothetical protein